MAANIAEVSIASKENWASMANCVEQILRLKKRNLERAGFDDTGTRVRRDIKQRPERKEYWRHLDISSTYGAQSGRGYGHEWAKGLHSEIIPP